MVECSKCNKQFEDGTQNCDQCGAPLYETIFCPNCGTQTSTEFDFCQNCGASIKEGTANTANTDGAQKDGSIVVAGKKIPKKWLLIGGAGIVALVVLIIVVASIIANLNSNVDFALYYKDDQVSFSDFTKDGTWQVTSKIFDDAESSYVNNAAFQITEDGETLFYPDRVVNSSNFALYYRSVTDKDAEPVKVDSSVRSYQVSDNGKYVVYLKGDESALYIYNVKKDEKEKIASDVSGFVTSDDCERIIYANEENGIYYKELGEDKVKLESDVSEISFVNEDVDTIYFIKEGSLYKREVDDERVKIASDVHQVEAVYESGEVYFLKSEEDTSASATLAPADSWYSDMAGSSSTVYTLCYYDGSEVTEIDDTVTYVVNYAYDAAVVIYKTEGEEADNIYVAAGAKTAEIDDEDAKAFRISDDGKTVYYIAGIPEDGTHGDLYQITISKKGEIGKATLYDTDVYPGYMTFWDDETFTYYKEVTTETYNMYSTYAKGELYMNKEKIDYDVRAGYVDYIEDTEEFVYFTDWSIEKSYGTLKVYDGEATKIMDDVHAFEISYDDEILFIADYSSKYFKGDLYRFTGKKSEKIDMDVKSIISIHKAD